MNLFIQAFIWSNSNPILYLQETYVFQPSPQNKDCEPVDLLRNSVRELITDRSEKKMMNILFNYIVTLAALQS